MNKLISGQEAINIIKQHMNYVRGGSDEYYLAHRHIIELIEVMPSVQPQRWIPVSETLPPSVELVNVSCHDDSGDTTFDYTSCGWITTNGEYWIVDNEINSFVVAWMPLPKPWKGEKHEL